MTQVYRPTRPHKPNRGFTDEWLTPWHGRVWLNPPYGPMAAQFMAKLAQHGNGIALVFARTETDWFHEHVWNAASAAVFIRGRLHFYDVEGIRAKGNAGGPSVLVAYGDDNAERIRKWAYSGSSARSGRFVWIAH
jgi:hypothetical protein